MRFPNLFRSAALLAAVPLALPAQSALPDAPGKDTVKKVCGDCHEISTVISARRTRTGWERMAEDMASRGAQGTDEEMAVVVNYLATFFGKINVNTASSADLQKTLALSEKEARAITSHREQNGRIKNFEELEKVPGVDPEKLRQKRSLIAFTQ